MSVPASVSWNADVYGHNLAHHRAFDADLLGSLGLTGHERVLDLGCGVGDLSQKLAAALPHGSVVGVDADPDMVRQASTRTAPNLRFEQVAAQQVADTFGAGSFDVVVSVAVLHWIPEADQPAVAHGVHRLLRPGGRFRADFGGQGQIDRPRQLLDDLAVAHGGSVAPWYFPSPDDYRRVLEPAGLSVEHPGWIRRLDQRRPFDLVGARGWLASQVSIAYLPGLPATAHGAFLDGVEEKVLPALRRSDGSYDQDYVRIDLLASAVAKTSMA